MIIHNKDSVFLLDQFALSGIIKSCNGLGVPVIGQLETLFLFSFSLVILAF